MNKKGGAFKVMGIILLCLILIFIILSVIGNGDKNKTPYSEKNYSSINKGVGFLSRGNFVEDLKTANEVGLVFLNAASSNGEIPEIIVVGFESGYIDYPVPNMAGDADLENQKKAYSELIKKYKPHYIGLGNEIELMPDKNEFVSIYNELYDSVKSECEDCVVYPTFQYENFEPNLARQMKMDLLVFTSYPFIKYSDIKDIPSDYYLQAKEIDDEKNLKVAFTEIGWTALLDYRSGYEDFDSTQVAFYKKFKDLTDNLDIDFVGWGLLYGAPEVGAEWEDMGLLDSQGNKKQIFEEFRK